VRDRARRRNRGRVPSEVVRCRHERIDAARAGGEAVRLKLHDEPARAIRRNHDSRIVRIDRLVAGSGDLERAGNQARKRIGGGHSGHLHQFVVRRPEGAADRRHAGNDGRGLIELDRYRPCGRQPRAVRRRARDRLCRGIRREIRGVAPR